MKYKVFTLTLACCIHLVSLAQKTVDVPLENGEITLDFVNLREHGFILKTGKEKYYSKNLDWQLSYYTPTLDLVWKAPLETTQINKGLSQDIIASPSGNYVYHLEKRAYTVGAADYFLTQVNSKGETKTLELGQQALEDMKGKTVFRFCDDKYLYFINVNDDKGKDDSDQVFIHKISHADFSVQTKAIDMPMSDKSFTNWEYVAHSDKNIWLACKALDGNQSYQYQVVASDWNGGITHKTTFNHHLGELYVRPSINHRYIPGADGFSNGGISAMSTTNHSTGMTHTSYTLGEEAYGGILIDDDKSLIYVYGLYGNKKALGRASYVDGFYLAAYNMKGQQLWQQVSAENDILMDDKYFRTRLLQHQRTTMASLTKDHHIKLQIGSAQAIFTNEFSSTGKKLASYANTFKAGANYYNFFMCFAPEHPATQYYQDHFSKRKSFYGSSFSGSSILIEDDKKNKVSLYQL